MKFVQIATGAVLECNNESVVAQMLKHTEAYTKVEEKAIVEEEPVKKTKKK